jgi:hypothetical protein
MDDQRTRHATHGQLHDLWSAFHNIRQEIDRLSKRVASVEEGPDSAASEAAPPVEEASVASTVTGH